MLEFKKVELDDIFIMKGYLQEQDFRSCDFTAGAIYMWRDFFYSEYVLYKEMLIFKVAFPQRGTSFAFPIGKGSLEEAFTAIERYAMDHNEPLRLCTLPRAAKEYVEERYGDKATFLTNRNWYDYIYKAEDLKEFAGKKYRTQRNHTHRFLREYPNYEYKRIEEKDLAKLEGFLDEYASPTDAEGRMEKRETIRARDYLDNFLALGHLGGYIEVDGQVVACAIGETIKDTLYVHVEKANTDYHGAYQMIVSHFAKDFARDEVIYINREDDVGDPGLRKSKLAYRPIELLEKFCCSIELE